MRTYIAFPKDQLPLGLRAELPYAAAVEFGEDKLKDVVLARRITAVAYAGHAPDNAETTYNFFGSIDTAEKSDYFTNLTQAGKLPWSGRFYPWGIGMMIGPAYIGGTVNAAHLDDAVTGSFSLEIGSGFTSAFKGPNMLLFSQGFSVAMSPNATNATDKLYGLLNSPFVGKSGFFPIPELEPMTPDTPFRVKVEWDGTAWSTASLVVWFLLFGKRDTPFGQ